MRILYICHTRFPSEKAYGHQIAQVCTALAQNGHEVELVCPDVAGALPGGVEAHYRNAGGFRVTKLPAFDALQSPFIPGPLAVHVTWASYRRSLRTHLEANRPDLVYARSAAVLSPAIALAIPAVLELHTVPSRLRWGFLPIAWRCRTVVALTTPMRDALVARGVPAERIIVEPDGVDLDAFAKLPAKAEAKARWKLPTDRPIIAYVGSLKSGHDLPKGVEELVEAAALLKAHGERFFLWIVGGPASEVRRLQALATSCALDDSTVRFEGPVPSADVPAAIAAADLGVYPAPKSSDPFFYRDTSPLKLLEYMAAGLPTVSADLPPVRDLLGDNDTRFCAPGDSADLARALSAALADPAGSATRAQAAKARVARLSWRERMARITSLYSA